MYTGDFRTEERMIITEFLNGGFTHRSIPSISESTKLPISKVSYIINRSKLFRKSKQFNNNLKELYTLNR